MSRPELVSFTEQAVSRVKNLIADSDNALGIRISLKTRGCSGLQWEMEFARDRNKFDELVNIDGVNIFVDPKAVLYIIGTVVDYEEDELEKGFVFKNPNEKGKCGCGESFNV